MDAKGGTKKAAKFGFSQVQDAFDILLQKKVNKREENFIERYRSEISFLI